MQCMQFEVLWEHGKRGKRGKAHAAWARLAVSAELGSWLAFQDPFGVWQGSHAYLGAGKPGCCTWDWLLFGFPENAFQVRGPAKRTSPLSPCSERADGSFLNRLVVFLCARIIQNG